MGKVCSDILKKEEALTVESWTSQAEDHFDFSKFRRVFNVLREEQLEKELIAHFSEWNDLFNEDSDSDFEVPSE